MMELNERTVRKAVRGRVMYIAETRDTLTMKELRRLLEKDMEVEAGALDAFKAQIKAQVDEASSPRPRVLTRLLATLV